MGAYLGIDEEGIGVFSEMSLTDAHRELQMQEEGLARRGFRLDEHGADGDVVDHPPEAPLKRTSSALL